MFNPTIQYFNQSVIHRAAYPESELPTLNQAIQEQMERDEEIFENAEQEMAEFDDAFEITVNEDETKQKEKKRVYWRDIIEREEQK